MMVGLECVKPESMTIITLNRKPGERQFCSCDSVFACLKSAMQSRRTNLFLGLCLAGLLFMLIAYDEGPFVTVYEFPQDSNNLFFSRNTSTYINLLNVRPPQYLSNYRNPCWEEKVPESSPYRSNPFYKLGVGMYLKEYEKQLEEDRANDVRVRLRCLPYFYVAGFTKCGTSDLYDKISQHPHVTRENFKELDWWKRRRVHPSHAGSTYPISTYVDMFDNTARKIQQLTETTDEGFYHPMVFGEGSPSTVRPYTDIGQNPENNQSASPTFLTPHYMYHVTPQARIIVMVRDPVPRLYSSYLYFGSYKPANPEDFHERVVQSIAAWGRCWNAAITPWDCLCNRTLKDELTLKELVVGLYSVYLKPWVEVFPQNQLLVLRLEDYSRHKPIVIKQVYDFLGLDPVSDHKLDSISNIATRNNHSSRKDRAGPMLEKTSRMLRNFYEPYNQDLVTLMGDTKFSYAASYIN